ncbi:transmembrane protein 94 isoform X1 [Lampetra fluviatilis]
MAASPKSKQGSEGPERLGLATVEALGILKQQLEKVLADHQQQQEDRPRSLAWQRSFLHHGNRWSCFHLLGALLMLLAGMLLLCCHGGQPKGSEGAELVNGLALLALLGVNLYVMGRQARLKDTEIPRRLRSLLDGIGDTLRECGDGRTTPWEKLAYPDLLMPHSKAIALQWAYRDGALINLPLSLLVEGDVISLRPGQDAPVHLRGIKDEEHLLLAPGDLFLRPSPLASPVTCDRGRPHAPQKPRQFRVTRTPVLESVRKCLEGGTGRPVSVLDNECFAARTLLHRFVVPATLLLLLVTNALRFILKAPGIGSPVYTFIQLQVNGVLPLLPLIFPGLWVLVNAYGEAKVLAQFSKAPPTPLLAKFSEDTISSYTEVVSSKEMCLCEWSHFIRVLRGRSPALCQTGSLLHNLGSVTVLCCVDKQGVLSWANPSPEKVVFFSSQPGPEPGYDDDDDDDGEGKDDEDEDEEMGEEERGDEVDEVDEVEEVDEVADARRRKAGRTAVSGSSSAVRLLEAEWAELRETQSLLPPSADIERGPDQPPRPLEGGRRSCAAPSAAAATSGANAATFAVGSSPRCCPPATPGAKPAGASVVSFCQCVEGGAGEPEKERRRDGLEVEAIAELAEEEEEEEAATATGAERHGDDGDDVDGETDDFVCDYRLEVLSLSQDQQNPASVQFDDARWPLHATSLKPLGLNVLLTACNAPLAPRTLRLCDHLAQAARAGRAASSCLPTRPPWGLCELPRIIGFTPGAKDVFSVESYLALFQLPSGEHLPSGRDRARRLSAVVKRRLPIGHLVSLLVKDLNSGDLQLLSHGTADVVLDACTDFWDGFDIYPLSASDRKKVLDFYQRTCLSGYCVAFAYKPMHGPLAPELDRRCVELPPGHDPFGAIAASANAATAMAALSAPGGPAENLGGSRHADTPGHTPVKTSGARKNSWSSDEGIGEGAERGEGVQALSGQIFMGLVSAQYQARLDIVRLIDGLDSACIRFVYFSMEDELRSKVFAEKMGLESGWNCHISLQSSGYDLGTDAPPHSPSQASSLHDHAQQEREVQMLLEEETHSDVVSYPPTDSDAPSILEYSNRAKLPRGIENVRPHLENIDNVPLLVPLFTDCTPDTMCEMVAVMQEHGEVVCCLGSSANVRNGRVFLQSNVSIAVDPLYPSRCTWERFGFAPSGMPADTEAQGGGPLRLSGQLNGLPCSVAFHHEENLSIIKLIKQARHTINGMRKCFLFLLQCQLSLVLLQVVSCLVQLPPPLSTTDVLWMSCVSHPLISVSLLGKQPDNSVMTIATGKNLMVLPRRTVHYYVLCFLGKFLPSVCIYLCCFALTLNGFCRAGSKSVGNHNATHCDSYPFSQFDGTLWFGDYSNALLLAQKITAGFLLLNSLCVLVTHVHRTQPLWRHSPFTNTWWTAMVPLLLALQAVQAAVDVQLWRNGESLVAVWLADVPVVTWLLGFLWLIPLVVVNELIKLHEIRMRVRYQKRQKLQFETKLGMNSPF